MSDFREKKNTYWRHQLGRHTPAAEPAPPTDGLREELAAYFWCGVGTWERAKEWERDSYWRMADDVLALPGIQRLIAAEEAVRRVRNWVASMDDLARQYREAAASVAAPDLIAEATEHAEDVQASADGVRRALDGELAAERRAR